MLDLVVVVPFVICVVLFAFGWIGLLIVGNLWISLIANFEELFEQIYRDDLRSFNESKGSEFTKRKGGTESNEVGQND